MGVVVADTAELVDLIDPDAELTKVGEGYVFTEGPAWSPAEQAMYFSDIPGDARFRWSESGGVERIMAPTYKANGMAFDRDGCLIVCEHVTSAISRFHADGTHETVCFHHNGTYLNSPNDLVTYGRDGSIYFTDPDYGRWNDWIGCERPGRPLGFTAVFSVLPEGGEARLVSEPGEFEQPNGLCFSPDETVLYVNDSPRAHIKAFDVTDDGGLSNGRVFADGMGGGSIEEGSPDGMECDEFGNVWCSGPGGVWVFAPDGRRLGRLRTPEVYGSLAWGGRDLRTLFLTTSTTVQTIATKCASAPLPHYHPGDN